MGDYPFLPNISVMLSYGIDIFSSWERDQLNGYAGAILFPSDTLAREEGLEAGYTPASVCVSVKVRWGDGELLTKHWFLTCLHEADEPDNSAKSCWERSSGDIRPWITKTQSVRDLWAQAWLPTLCWAFAPTFSYTSFKLFHIEIRSNLRKDVVLILLLLHP